MKILIIYTNTYRMLAPAPLGASLVAARLRRDGHEVRLLDLMFASNPPVAAARLATGFQPDLVAYSIRNVDNQSARSFTDPFPGIQAVVAAVRSAWPAPALLGGTAFTTFPIQYMEALETDYGMAGDDLAPISRFVASLATAQPDLETPGLVYRSDAAICQNPFVIKGYASTPFDGMDLIDYTAYRRCLSTMWEAAVITRSGCPFDCVFCDTFRTFGKNHVLRQPG
jgi:radical SAM superfamily enzyme YgiQ (UPF0313 family)